MKQSATPDRDEAQRPASRKERARQRPTDVLFKKAAAILGCTPEELERAFDAPRSEQQHIYDWMLDHPYDAMLAFMEATNCDTFGMKPDTVPLEKMREFLKERIPELKRQSERKGDGK